MLLVPCDQLDGGLGHVTKRVCASLREWLASEGQAALAKQRRLSATSKASARQLSYFQSMLARLLQDLGQLEEAAPLFQEVLTVRRSEFGNTVPDTLSAINNMAGIRQAQGQLDEALALFQEALEGRRAHLGDRHIDTLATIASTAQLLEAQGKLDQAET